MNVRRAVLIATAASLAATLAAACGRKKPAGAISIRHFHVQLAYPAYGQAAGFDGTCTGAQSLLLSLDTGSSSKFEYRLITDVDGNLYGCGGNFTQACTANQVRFAFTGLQRIMVEGITTDPAGYGSHAAFDVACRGVAGGGEPGSVTMSGSTGQAAVPMLRVGNFNGLYDTAGPSYYWPAAAAVDGGVLVAGGEAPDGTSQTADVWRFDARAIAFTAESALPAPRSRIRAIEVPDWDGDPAVVFAGGLGNLAFMSSAWDVYNRHGVVRGSLPRTTAMAAAAFAPVSWAGNGGAIAMAGGCGYPPDNAATINDQVQYLLPSMPQNDPPRSGMTCTALNGQPAQQGNPAICIDDGGIAEQFMDNPVYCHMDAAAVDTNGSGAYTLWLPGGGRDDGAHEYGLVTGSYDLKKGVWDYRATGLTDGFRSSAAVSIDDRHALSLGGFVPGGAFKEVFLDDAGTIYDITSNGTLATARGAASAATLQDGTILLTGGLDDVDSPDDLDDVEIVTFVAGGGAGAVTTVEPLWVDGTDVKLMFPRSHHASVTLRNSGTWLDGSVVLTGAGLAHGFQPPELYVPAFPCATGPGCDRGVTDTDRPVTDPAERSPKPLP